MTALDLLARLADHAALALLDAEARSRLADYLEVVRFEPGDTLIREGERDRDLYAILEGPVRMRRGPLDLGLARPGELLGELALTNGLPRAATVIAHGQVLAVRLTEVAFERMAREDAELAIALLRVFVRGLDERLRAITDDVGRMLRERSLPRRRHITVQWNGGPESIRTGTRPAELLPERVDGALVVAAVVDGTATSLNTPLTSDCTVKALTTRHWEGCRIYRQSVGLLVLEAAAKVAPEAALVLDHSVELGRRVRVSGTFPPLPILAAEIQAEMRRLVLLDRTLREELWTRDEAAAHFAASGREDVAALVRTRRQPTVRLADYGRYVVLATGPLVPRTGLLQEARILADADGLIVLYGREGHGAGTPWTDDSDQTARSRAAAARRVAADAVLARPEHAFLGALDVHSVGEFNRACIDGRVAELIRVVEGSQEKRIGQIADAIAADADRLRVVCIAGPSSSGKTTFIQRLRVQLQVNGVRPVGLGLDDYFCDRDDTPRDAAGDFDFEAFEALRTDLLSDHLRRLLAGEQVRTARFDFVRGQSHADGGPLLSLQPGQILMIEGIHGLNPRLMAGVPEEAVFRVFVCPLQQLPIDAATRLHASDVRLLRRIVRDRHGRAQPAANTISRWPSVRRGERRHIFPFVQHADAVFDSSLVYEPSVLKVFAERYLLEVPPGDPATVTAQRLLGLLDDFVTVYPNHVPPTSILREFIGGSGFES